MRITSSSYYNNIYGENNKLNRQLFDVNKQISSGQVIQYSHENPEVFIDTMRLDDEITTLTQIKKSSESAFKFSTQTDTVIGEIVSALESLKVKLVNAANDTNSEASLYAISKEMRGLENHLKNLANSSVGGAFLFSGTAVNQKPITNDGEYLGNDYDLKTSLGSGVRQKYNISGSDLFLGNESSIARSIATNISQYSMSDLYPHIMQTGNVSQNDSKKTVITADSTIRDLMGDTDADATNDPMRTAYFYIQGTRHNGETFKQKIDLKMGATVDDLLQEISDAFGKDQVLVSLDHEGHIQVDDRTEGSSKLNFHIVGAVDFNSDGIDDADTVDLKTLQNGTTDFNKIADGSKGLYIKEFVKSNLTSSDPNATIEGLQFDQFNFDKKGSKLFSNTAQIVKDTNAYATAENKLVDVSGMESVDGRVMSLTGKNIFGASYDISILLGTPSSFTDNLTGQKYTIYGTNYDDTLGTIPNTKESNEGIPSKADEVTYRQLMDIANMALTGSLPLTIDDPVAYDKAIENANSYGEVNLSSSGKIFFEDYFQTNTKAEIALYDTTTDSFFPPLIKGNALSFQSNNAVTLRDPKKDFFAEIDEMIKSVEEGKKYPDGTDPKNPRNIGIQNSIQRIDDLMDHVSRLQSEAGSYSQILQMTSERTDLLIISTTKLQSEVLDTDIAEASMRMQQLTLNYQALLSNISKVSKLSLVNYL